MHMHVRSLVRAAVLAALVCVATMVIQIPSPLSGYMNMGDCFVLLAAVLLGPIWGTVAGGIGSMLADLLSGYAQYVPGTFVIKALMALLAALIFRALSKRSSTVAMLAGGLAAELWMVTGDFLYEATFLQYGLSAAAGIPGNLMQGAFGIVAGLLLYRLLVRMHAAPFRT